MWCEACTVQSSAQVLQVAPRVPPRHLQEMVRSLAVPQEQPGLPAHVCFMLVHSAAIDLACVLAVAPFFVPRALSDSCVWAMPRRHGTAGREVNRLAATRLQKLLMLALGLPPIVPLGWQRFAQAYMSYMCD